MKNSHPSGDPAAKGETLVLQIWDGVGGIIYGKADEDWVGEVMKALKAATSWADLRERLPDGAADRMNIGDWEDSEEPYDPSHVDMDGLIAMELLVTASERVKLPSEVSERFGRFVGSPVAGTWEEFQMDDADQIRDALQAAGYTLIIRDTFVFPWDQPEDQGPS